MQKKYEAVVFWVLAEIENGNLNYGDRLPSEKDLMEKFQVSRQTVRRALEVLAEKGTVEGRRGSGTYIAVNRRRRGKREIRIAVMPTYVDTYIFPSIIRGIESVFSREGCTLQLSVTNNTAERERMFLKEFLQSQSVDGVIAETVKSGLPSPNLELYTSLEKSGIPVLFINSFYSELDIPHISLNDRKAGYVAAKHLLDCGHTRIGGIFKADDGQGRLRYAGYADAMMERDIKVRGSKVIWMDSEEIRDMEEEPGRILKRLKDCTGCVCYNDEIANHLVEIFKKAGMRVPRDISIVGIDNSSLAQFCSVPLTSVRNPVEELGRAAAERMAGKICRNQMLATEEFEPELVMRNSVRVISEVS